jgi:hypothetical protein
MNKSVNAMSNDALYLLMPIEMLKQKTLLTSDNGYDLEERVAEI